MAKLPTTTPPLASLPEKVNEDRRRAITSIIRSLTLVPQIAAEAAIMGPLKDLASQALSAPLEGKALFSEIADQVRIAEDRGRHGIAGDFLAGVDVSRDWPDITKSLRETINDLRDMVEWLCRDRPSDMELAAINRSIRGDLDLLHLEFILRLHEFQISGSDEARASAVTAGARLAEAAGSYCLAD